MLDEQTSTTPDGDAQSPDRGLDQGLDQGSPPDGAPDGGPGVTPEPGTEPATAPADTGAGETITQPAPQLEEPPPPARKRAPRKTAAKKTAVTPTAPPVDPPAELSAESGARGTASADAGDEPPADPAEGDTPPAKKRAPRKRTSKKAAAAEQPATEPPTIEAAETTGTTTDVIVQLAAEGIPTVRDGASDVVPTTGTDIDEPAGADGGTDVLDEARPPRRAARRAPAVTPPAVTTPLFRAPDPVLPSAGRAGDQDAALDDESDELDDQESVDDDLAVDDERDDLAVDDETDETDSEQADEAEDTDEQGDGEGEGGSRRRRRRGGRRRRRGSDARGADRDPPARGNRADDQVDDPTDDQAGEPTDDRGEDRAEDPADDQGAGSPEGRRGETAAEEAEGEAEGEGGTSRRRRRRRRSGDSADEPAGDPENTVTKVRKGRSAEDEITGFTGSTRLEAKKQRRREGREAGRRRAPVISEAEFLARRESVDRTMVIRQRGDLTQIAVLEDGVLVEHYVARESQSSLIGNIYVGRVQNVLPSMEAAFIDIGKGRNAVLYAGEVNWDLLGAKEGNQRKIEQVLKSGQPLLVQVSKDPVGHKGARLTSQISLPGRFLVYVPDGTTSGISRKLPETERTRLKTLLKEIVPESAGVIVRTAAEGASEEELTRDVERLKARWEEISAKAANGSAPQLLYGEPDLTLKVVRDLFTEDFARLVVSGEEAWDVVEGYVQHVAPDLVDRLERHDDSERDAFAEHRIDEQIAKGLDRKVFLPSGGSLVIDRTEAMTVVDVNTGKFTGSGGNLEETVTKNNLEAAEEIVRQLRLRDIGGIIVVDFIDMVLEGNRDLVLRRLVECLGRDRTRHQVAEVTSLGLVQMTRKRIGTGLLEAFSEPCEACQGRGVHVHVEPVEERRQTEDEPRRNRRPRTGRRDERDSPTQGDTAAAASRPPTPAEFAAMVRPEAVQADVEVEQADELDQLHLRDEMSDAASPAAEPPAPKEPAPETAAPETAAPEEPAPEEPAADEPPPAPAPAAPRVVTTVRRRGARRPAGPPAANGSAPASQEAAPDQDGADGTADAGVPPSDPASAGAMAGGTEPEPPPVEGRDPGAGLDDLEVVAAHVPVKKKGSRKW